MIICFFPFSLLTWCIALIEFFKIYVFIYFWLRRVFVAVCRPSLIARAGATLRFGVWASHCGGFSCCGAWALG